MTELGNADLGDARLDRRLVQVAGAMAAKPEASIPEACQGWAEVKGAYRLLDNERVTPARILAPHRARTLERMRGHGVVLAVQDTTMITVDRPAAKGLGPIGGHDTQGFLVHSCFAVGLDGVPLGLLGQEMWARPEREGKKPSGKRQGEDSESARWDRMLRETTQGVPEGTRVVTVADREADVYELFAAAVDSRQEVLIRAKGNRRTTEAATLWQTLAAKPVTGRMTVEVARSGDRPARKATLEVRHATVTLAPTGRTRDGDQAQPLRLTGILATEVDPPRGEDAIEWLLLATLAIASFGEAEACVRWYALRWRIERLHYSLKSGCRVEELQLETRPRLERALAIYSIVAWHLTVLAYEARAHPDEPCTRLLTPLEWKTLWVLAHKTKTLPPVPPTLRQAVRALAKIGGFLARKTDGEPGIKVIWRGYRAVLIGADVYETLTKGDVGNG